MEHEHHKSKTSSSTYLLNILLGFHVFFIPFTSYFRLVNALVKFLLSDFGVPMMRAVIDLFDDVVDTLVMLVVSKRGVLSCVEFCKRNRHLRFF